ncbi:MAG: pseudouridine synthase [Ignavibacteriales bacterium]|nr:MAG: pseudouridine synthase [Ignavibacteriales bacterium]
MSDYKYFILNKPYGVLSQFTDKSGRKTLAGCFNFPPNVYPVGRLDMDSEGLLLLTNDKELTDRLLNPEMKVEKEYWVQVEGIPSEDELDKLREGVEIEGRKTLPASVEVFSPLNIPHRNPPIRFRKNIPDSWLKIIINEGRYRQVRKMTAKAGHPTLRLIRVRIKNILLGELNSGSVRELTVNEIRELKQQP